MPWYVRYDVKCIVLSWIGLGMVGLITLTHSRWSCRKVERVFVVRKRQPLLSEVNNSRKKSPPWCAIYSLMIRSLSTDISEDARKRGKRKESQRFDSEELWWRAIQKQASSSCSEIVRLGTETLQSKAYHRDQVMQGTLDDTIFNVCYFYDKIVNDSMYLYIGVYVEVTS